MKVRIFAYDGIVQMQQHMVKQFNADSVFVLNDPYIWSQVINVGDGDPAAVSSTPYAPAPGALDTAQILRIEVPDAKQVRFEINPNGNGASTTRVAGDASPRLSGFNNFMWGPGYTLSVVDAAAYP